MCPLRKRPPGRQAEGIVNIGVFDSGAGGKSVAIAVERAFPEHRVIYVDDRENVPYGDKTPDQLLALVEPILRRMQRDMKCDVIVVACNTVTTTIITQLRDRIAVPLVAVEPMVKTAASLTKTKTIAVCATPATLGSPRYNELKESYASDIQVLEPDCSDWSRMIEASELNHEQIEDRIRAVCDAGADVIVLGCTHYHWIQEEIEETASEYPDVQVIQPEPAIIRRLATVLEQLS
ncbi:glutamate racemase [Patescibacteria group bacterium]|nr:MAG: glutamate racemase [Patescibacteria group bacterium]